MASKHIGDKTVCVTGGSGFIGAWIVRLLLDRGYTVHATVKNLYDENETKHLQDLEEHKSQRLRLFQIDLLDYDSIVKTITGVTGVFHLASPCTVDKVHDPEEVLGPAIKGTNNVLVAAKELGVKCVVITSSISAIVPKGGCTETYEDFFMGSVHVKDVALAHLLVYENPSATGRHLCVEAISHYGDFAAKVAELYPEHQFPSIPRDTQPGLLRSKEGAKKLMDLGLQFTSMEQIIKDSVESLKGKGFLS
ncbi:cinnamoyl-CoA reductase 1 [Heracleum sosnowskyi]|uniref:Cinnamoyl-CoA reductase 1 n=1 Tax=Heracleum sosnowskyi TaxID=360622 RepID=A0AAD8GUX1_9APIA|nr:cinnamoyl-CoA reductase 1 [Heracleum sosnowskyi]